MIIYGISDRTKEGYIKTKNFYKPIVKVPCDRDRIQTCNRLIRSQLLYSVELRGHVFFLNGCKDTGFLEKYKFFVAFFQDESLKEAIIQQLQA